MNNKAKRRSGIFLNFPRLRGFVCQCVYLASEEKFALTLETCITCLGQKFAIRDDWTRKINRDFFISVK